MDTSIDGLKRRSSSNKRKPVNGSPQRVAGGGFDVAAKSQPRRIQPIASGRRANAIKLAQSQMQTAGRSATKRRVAPAPSASAMQKTRVASKKVTHSKVARPSPKLPMPEDVKPTPKPQPIAKKIKSDDLLLGMDELQLEQLINDNWGDADADADILDLDSLDSYPEDAEEESYDMNFTSDDLEKKKPKKDTKKQKAAKKSDEDDFFNAENAHDDSDSLLDESEELENAKKQAKKDKKDKKRKKKKHRVRNAILIVLGLLIIAGVVLVIWGNDILLKLTGGRSGLWDTVWSMVDEGGELAMDEHGRTNILVFGTEGYDMNGSTGNGMTHDGAQLTDSIMIVSLDQKTKDVALLSIPRDLKVSGACMAGKVNEVFSCNNENGENEEAGAQAMMDEIGEILGLDFQYYAHVNWGSLINIIDTLGGITVVLDEDISDYYYTGFVAKAGEPVQLNGEQALGLARARHGTAGGDFTRGNSQQKILTGIVNKVLENGVGLTEAFNLLNILGDNLRTNFSSDDIKAALKVANGFDMNNIRQVPLVDYENNIYHVKSETINGISYVIPNEGIGRYSEIQKYVDKMFSSNPAAREGAEITILNATGVTGLAGKEADKLEAEGYDVGTISDTEAENCTEKYCIYQLNDTMSATATALSERYGLEVRLGDSLPAGMNASTADFVIIVGQSENSEE